MQKPSSQNKPNATKDSNSTKQIAAKLASIDANATIKA
jgi:hypothetical protein